MGTSAVTQDQMRRAGPTMPGHLMVPPSPFLGVLPPWMWEAPKELWTAPFIPQAATLAAGLNQTLNYQVDRNYYAVFYYGSLTVRASAAGKAIQAGFPLTFFLSTQNNDVYQPSGTTNDANNLFGTASQPAVWALPLILPPNTILNMLITNTHNATAVDVWPMLMGFLVNADFKAKWAARRVRTAPANGNASR